MAYEITWEERGVYCKFSGTVSGDDVKHCNNDIYGDERFDNIKYQIFDMLDVAKLSIEAIDARIAAACDCSAAVTNPNVKCALVATDEKAHTLSRAYQIGVLTSPWEGRSFTTIKDAYDWLSS